MHLTRRKKNIGVTIELGLEGNQEYGSISFAHHLSDDRVAQERVTTEGQVWSGGCLLFDSTPTSTFEIRLGICNGPTPTR
ncbi:hypothetical protein NPIL_464801 [Nephila pilipes]|uniref:Uncharacterized protein n=1 Tax=Nephila pilipes TaxID=299642 RepID=A0A8X6NG97_NEPPI|nr:hypothetical protein NPIL_464801 [Nephila pilipes]